MAALIVENLNLFLFAVTAVFALPAEISIPWIALPVCPLNWLMSLIAIAFLPSMKTFAISFSKTVHSLTVFFTLFQV